MKSSETVEQRILRHIESSNTDAPFITEDFGAYGNTTQINRALAALSRSGKLRRAVCGVYYRPRRNSRFGFEVTPSPEAIALALARKTGATIQVTGDYAANSLGLTTQIPARSVFLTDGNSRKVRFGRQVVELRHAEPSKMSTSRSRGGFVIHALRHLGKAGVNDHMLNRLREQLTNEELADLRQSRFLAPKWLQKQLSRITE